MIKPHGQKYFKSILPTYETFRPNILPVCGMWPVAGSDQFQEEKLCGPAGAHQWVGSHSALMLPPCKLLTLSNCASQQLLQVSANFYALIFKIFHCCSSQVNQRTTLDLCNEYYEEKFTFQSLFNQLINYLWLFFD